MKIAIPVSNGRLCPHFGHCDEFVIVDANGEDKGNHASSSHQPPPHEPGVLPGWLHGLGVNVIIAGGMGQRAHQLFDQHGIAVVVGAALESPETLVGAYLDGTLSAGENLCDH